MSIDPRHKETKAYEPAATRKERKEAVDVARQKAERATEDLRAAYNRVAKSTDGQAVLRHIMSHCGFHESPIVVNPTTLEVVNSSTIHNASRRTVWIDIRGMMSKTVRSQIESVG